MSVWKGFYVLEGIDGAGKSTAIERLKEIYKKKGKGAVSFTSEPTSAGRKMLSALRYRSAPREPHADSLSYLFAADRNEHLYGNGGIKDRLSQGVKVVCDRYLFSSLAYQGAAGKDSAALAFRLNMANADFPYPEVLFYLDIGVDAALERIKNRRYKDPMETRDFLQKVAERYSLVLENCTFGIKEMRIVRLDALQPQEEIAEAIWREIWRQEQGRV